MALPFNEVKFLISSRYFANRGEVLAIGTESNALDDAGMSPQGEEFPASGRVPQLHRTVPADGGQTLAIRTEGHATSLGDKALFDAGYLPDLHRSFSAGGGQL